MGVKGFQKGHFVSKETREKISKANNGKFFTTSKTALDLINRQKAEIERLHKSLEEAISCFNRMESLYKIKCKELEIAKSEAIKEFAENAKKECYATYDEVLPSLFADIIDNLVKEMTEVNKNDDTKNNISSFNGDRSIR